MYVRVSAVSPLALQLLGGTYIPRIRDVNKLFLTPSVFFSLSLVYTSITFWRQDVKPASGLVTRITYPNEGLDLGNYHRRLRFITIGIRVPVGGQIRRKKLTLERGTLQVTLAAVVPSSEAVTRLRVNVNFFSKEEMQYPSVVLFR